MVAPDNNTSPFYGRRELCRSHSKSFREKATRRRPQLTRPSVWAGNRQRATGCPAASPPELLPRRLSRPGLLAFLDIYEVKWWDKGNHNIILSILWKWNGCRANILPYSDFILIIIWDLTMSQLAGMLESFLWFSIKLTALTPSKCCSHLSALYASMDMRSSAAVRRWRGSRGMGPFPSNGQATSRREAPTFGPFLVSFSPVLGSAVSPQIYVHLEPQTVALIRSRDFAGIIKVMAKMSSPWIRVGSTFSDSIPVSDTKKPRCDDRGGDWSAASTSQRPQGSWATPGAWRWTRNGPSTPTLRHQEEPASLAPLFCTSGIRKCSS